MILGFRAHAFGHSDCCAVQSGYKAALSQDADAVLAELLVFARLMGHEGHRKISLTAPGCCRLTRDEVSIAGAFHAAQAWDEFDLDAHLSWLLAGPVPRRIMNVVTSIADSFAGHGLAFEAPQRSRVTQGQGSQPFRVVKRR